MDFAPMAIVVQDAQGRVRAWNAYAETLFGWQSAEVLGRTLPFGPDADRIVADRRLQFVLEGERIEEHDLECVRQDGSRFTASVVAAPLTQRDGRVFGALSVYTDTSECKRAEHHMILQGIVLRALSESDAVADAITRTIQAFCGISGWVCGAYWVVDAADGAMRCQDVWYAPNDAALQSFAKNLSAQGVATTDSNHLARNVIAKAAPQWITDSTEHAERPNADALREASLRCAFAFPVTVDDEVLGAIELYARERRETDRDLMRIAGHLGGLLGQYAARRETERRLQFVVSHDPLTGLPNRTIFGQRLGQALAQAARYEHKLALLFVDLDRFKVVNDTMGHEAGDRLLREVADRLRDSLREGDTVGRHGGDEFVVLIEQYESAVQVAGVAQKIIDQAVQPYVIDGHEFIVSASIGIATYPNDGQDGATLFKHADIAMYRAKEAGKNQYQFYSPHMNRLSHERIEMEAALRHALERGEFALVYQPTFDMAGRQMMGMEALLRWKRAGASALEPAEFLSITEETGLAVHIGEWVLRTACAQARMWQDRGFSPLRVAVNVSPRHFAHGNLVGCIDDVLRATRLPPNRLELEITEPTLLQNTERAERVLRMLKELGVGIAIDDFGTGHSSIGYLKRFPIDAVKVDRAFIGAMPQDANAVSMTRAVIAVAHSLHLRAVAEGVETEEQARYLRIQGCDEMQGYLFCAPVPPEQVLELLERGQPPSDTLSA